MGAGAAGHARPDAQRQDDERLQCTLAAHTRPGLPLLPVVDSAEREPACRQPEQRRRPDHPRLQHSPPRRDRRPHRSGLHRRLRGNCADLRSTRASTSSAPSAIMSMPATPRLATVKGLPGSGKTISLFYLVRDLALQSNLQHLLYVTYTSRLKRAARDFLAAQAPEMEGRIHIRTLTELEKEITGLPTYVDPLGELADFQRYLDRQPASTLGTWRRYPASLYTEVRAHILGRTFPAGYPLPAEPAGRSRLQRGSFRRRRLRRRPRPDRRRSRRRHPPGRAAARGSLLPRPDGRRPRADARRPAQAAGVAAPDRRPDRRRGAGSHAAPDRPAGRTGPRARARERNGRMALVVAGDESQIVQPSGFDWGVTKDLLREVLHVNPSEFEFRHQRRSPRNLAYLIDNSWNFYVTLPKALRPSANRQSFLDEADVELAVSTHRPDAAEENGRLLICPLPEHLRGGANGAVAHWQTFAEELAELPGRVLVDLGGTLAAAIPPGQENKAGEVIFTAREIKGLERNTVLILGLNETYRQAMRLADLTSDSPPLFEARRLMDEMRVAISRSTDKLVLFEAPDAAVLEALNIDHIAGHYTTTWGALRDLLRTEEMSEIEVVEGYLDEVDDLVGARALGAGAAAQSPCVRVRRADRGSFAPARGTGAVRPDSSPGGGRQSRPRRAGCSAGAQSDGARVGHGSRRSGRARRGGRAGRRVARRGRVRGHAHRAGDRRRRRRSGRHLPQDRPTSAAGRCRRRRAFAGAGRRSGRRFRLAVGHAPAQGRARSWRAVGDALRRTRPHHGTAEGQGRRAVGCCHRPALPPDSARVSTHDGAIEGIVRRNRRLSAHRRRAEAGDRCLRLRRALDRGEL